MAAKKAPTSALPLMMDNDQTPSATITYANEVVAIIAGLAANEVEGIAGMCNISGNILNKNRNVTRGVKVEIGTEEVAVDLYVIVEYGTPIQRAAMDAQESVRKAIESMTGLHVVRVDVHVQSVSFEQENKALQAGAASAALEAGVMTDRDDEPEKKEKAKTVLPKAADAPKPEKKPETMPEETADIIKEQPKPEISEAEAEKTPEPAAAPEAEKEPPAEKAKDKPAAPRKKASRGSRKEPATDDGKADDISAEK